MTGTTGFQAQPFATLLTRPDLQPLVQTRWNLGNASIGWKPLPPVAFTVDGKEGINLVDALDMGFSHLDDHDDLIFVEDGIRYPVWMSVDVLPYPRHGPRWRFSPLFDRFGGRGTDDDDERQVQLTQRFSTSVHALSASIEHYTELREGLQSSLQTGTGVWRCWAYKGPPRGTLPSKLLAGLLD